MGALILLFAVAGHLALLLGARVAVTRALPEAHGRALAFAKAGAGITGFWLASAIATTAGLVVAGEQTADEVSMHVAVSPGGPADRAGVRNGDRVVTADGAPVTDWPSLRALVAAKAEGVPVVLGLERAGAHLDVPVVPEGTPPRIRVGPPVAHVDVGVLPAIGRALAQPVVMMGRVAQAATRSARREPTELAGPVAIVSSAQDVERQRGAGATLLFSGAVGAYFVWIVAVVSLVVALVVKERRA